jgi:hypothetical protein
MTQRLLRFGVAQCFQGPAQLSLDFRGEDDLVRRETLCKHRIRERHCGEEECEESNVLHNSRNHSHYICREYSRLTQLNRRLEQFLNPPYARYFSSFAYALHLAAHKTSASAAPVCICSHTHSSRPHHGMRTPVKTTRDSHSEQCAVREKTSAREARGGLKHNALLSFCVKG